ncbi:MAG TPA: Sec-independent protein translocase protein TatB [Rhodocyclaceae bacterium]|nr:Sec-independent protein translocase protein TatB [Rhodocyclaceae bacterium]
MFDVGLSELIVIAVVALVVIGPERLPSVARTVGGMLGRAQRYFNSIKAEVNRELQLEELRRLQQETYDRVMAMETEVKTELAQIEHTIHEAGAEAQTVVKSAVTVGDEAVKPAIADAAPDSMVQSLTADAEASTVPEVDPRQGDLFSAPSQGDTEPPKHV